jgi:hypothetical protein
MAAADDRERLETLRRSLTQSKRLLGYTVIDVPNL